MPFRQSVCQDQLLVEVRQREPTDGHERREGQPSQHRSNHRAARGQRALSPDATVVEGQMEEKHVYKGGVSRHVPPHREADEEPSHVELQTGLATDVAREVYHRCNEEGERYEQARDGKRDKGIRQQALRRSQVRESVARNEADNKWRRARR